MASSRRWAAAALVDAYSALAGMDSIRYLTLIPRPKARAATLSQSARALATTTAESHAVSTPVVGHPSSLLHPSPVPLPLISFSHLDTLGPLILAVLLGLLLLAIAVRMLISWLFAALTGHTSDGTSRARGLGLRSWFRATSPIYDGNLIAQKTQHVAYHSVLRLYAISPSGTTLTTQASWLDWRKQILDQATAAYRQFHTANAGYFRPRHLWSWQARRLLPKLTNGVRPYWATPRQKAVSSRRVTPEVHLQSRTGWTKGIGQSTHMLSVAEVADLWHLPQATDVEQVPFLQDWAVSHSRLAPRTIASFSPHLGLENPQSTEARVTRVYTPQEERLLQALPLVSYAASPQAVSKLDSTDSEDRTLSATSEEAAHSHQQPEPGTSLAFSDISEQIGLSAMRQVSRGGALVLGVSQHSGQRAEVVLTPTLLGRHTLAIGGTGKGKSSLLLALARCWLQTHFPGEPVPGMVLIDPHGDLASSLLQSVHAERLAHVLVLDLADTDYPFGLNPLDVTLGRSRDKTCEDLMSIFQHIWASSWGYRMEDIWKVSLKTLFEANETLVLDDPLAGPDQQYTLLDVPPLLTSKPFRRMVLAQIHDFELLAWWERFNTWDFRFRTEATLPVLNKVDNFGGSMIARRVLGQARSTLDLASALQTGKVVVVNTAENVVGADTAALVGATVLGLVHMALREQARLPSEHRRRTQMVIDEFQTIPGANYASMLSELRKYGGVFVLATQSLAHLDRLGPTLRATVLSNVSNLFAFGMSAEDARKIAPELDGTVTEQDLINLDDFICYARLTENGQHLRTFSVMLMPPPSSDPAQEDELRKTSRALVCRPAESVDKRLRQAVRRRMSPDYYRERQIQEMDAVDPMRNPSKQKSADGNIPLRWESTTETPTLQNAKRQTRRHRTTAADRQLP